MTMIGSDDDKSFVPRFLCFDPSEDFRNRIGTGKDGSDRIVDVVGVVCPVDIAGFE